MHPWLYSTVNIAACLLGEWSVGRLFASGKREKNGFHCMTNNHKTQEVAKKRSKVVELKFDVCKNIFCALTKFNCKPSFLHKNKKQNSFLCAWGNGKEACSVVSCLKSHLRPPTFLFPLFATAPLSLSKTLVFWTFNPGENRKSNARGGENSN